MRIASLQPSVAITLAHLGALDCVCAATRFCIAAVPELAERKITVLPDSWSFAEADQATLSRAAADLVIASVPYREQSLSAILKAAVPVLALAPHTLADVYQDARLIARQVDRLPLAETLIERLQTALTDVQSQTASTPPQTVYCEEWGKPLIASQPWVAELIATANGQFVGKPGAQTTVDAIAEADPDVLLFAWCGAGDRVPLERVIAHRQWQDLRAVRERCVFCIPDEFLNTPSFNLQDGLACLAAALHPNLFPAQPGLRRLRSPQTLA